MKQIYEYLSKSSKVVHNKPTNRFWIRGGSGGVNITHKNFKEFYAKFIDEDVDWRTVDSLRIEQGEIAQVCIEGSNPCDFKYKGSFSIGGNILGLTRMEYKDSDDIKQREFANAFADSDITDARDLVITSKEIESEGMMGMFNSCQELKWSPELPSRFIGEECYAFMFQYSGLKYPPKILPAMTLSKRCYAGMFEDCYLDYLPVLPALELAEECYRSMFYNCDINQELDKLPARIMKKSCYMDMFAMSNLTTSPEICADKLADDCFKGMFANDKSLVEVIFSSKILKADLKTTAKCFNEWIHADAWYGKPKIGPGCITISRDVELPPGKSGIPEDWNRLDP